MKRMTYAAAAAVILSCGVGADTEFRSLQAEYEQWRQQELDAFDAYVAAYEQAYAAYRSELLTTWGSGDVGDSQRWVSYSEDLNVRREVDFARGEISISIQHSPEQVIEQQQFEQQLRTLLDARVDQVVAQDPVLSKMPDGPPILAVSAEPTAVLNQTLVANTNPKALLAKATVAHDKVNFNVAQLREEADRIQQRSQALKREASRQVQQVLLSKTGDSKVSLGVEHQVQQAELSKHQRIDKSTARSLQQLTKEYKVAASRAQNTPARSVTTVVVKLPDSNLAQKAKPYLTDVSRLSRHYKLDQSLVLGIMHVESHFNPLARSHIPAYGLMQIVPSSAGVDVNRFLHKKDEPLSADYLYQPSQNIEAGSVFLHLLTTRYLKRIDDPTSRLFCAIAAYNTGAGNVARVFTQDGSMNINKAAKIINELTPQQVHTRLLAELPYEETRNYLKKVLTRRQEYLAAASSL